MEHHRNDPLYAACKNVTDVVHSAERAAAVSAALFCVKSR